MKTYSYDDVLLVPQRGVLESRADADISVWIAGDLLSVPFFSAPMPTVTDEHMAALLRRSGGMGIVNRIGVKKIPYLVQEAYYAVGLDREYVKQLESLGVTRFCLDVAHAHSLPVMRFLDSFERTGKWMVGNVATRDAIFDLEQLGVDVFKVGIGPGSVCTTREVTGHGVPQLSAIMECRSATELPILADGGIRTSGDIVKALSAGADAVVIGRLFAEAAEAPGGGAYYGNASYQANGHNAPEGISVTLNLNSDPESLVSIIKRLAWGLKSGVSYAGVRSISNLRDNPQWQLVSEAGREESRAG